MSKLAVLNIFISGLISGAIVLGICAILGDPGFFVAVCIGILIGTQCGVTGYPVRLFLRKTPRHEAGLKKK